MTPEPLERSAFETWLASLPPEATVGISRTRCDCPLARFLRERGFRGAAVGNWRAENADGGRIDLPLWARTFIQRVDDFRGEVVAEGALRILRSIPE